jgi:hypothetical protein
MSGPWLPWVSQRPNTNTRAEVDDTALTPERRAEFWKFAGGTVVPEVSRVAAAIRLLHLDYDWGYQHKTGAETFALRERA